MGAMRRTAEEAAETREALLAAGLRVFATRGYTAATLAEVAAEAGVTRGAVYHHFSDKADLYLSAVGERWSRVVDGVWAHLVAEGPPRERVRRFVAAFYTALTDDPAFRELLSVTIGNSEKALELDRGLQAKREALREWVTQLTDLFTQAEQAGQLRDGMSPSTAAIATVVNLTGVVVAWSLGLEEFLDVAGDVEELCDAVLGGIFR
jgi:TetR/AcrR family transcriptional regulator, acrAB operon repressor